MGSLTKEMQDFYRTATAEQQRMTDAYEESLGDRIKGEDDVAKKRRAALMQIYKLEQQYRDKRDQLVKEAVVHNRRVQNANIQYTRALKAYNDAMLNGTQVQKDIAKQNLAIQRRDNTTAVMAQQSNRRAVAEADAGFRTIFSQRMTQEKKLGSFWSMTSERLGTNIKNILTSTLTKAFSGAALAAGAKEYFETLKTEITAGISVPIKDQLLVGAKFGLSPKEYAQLTKASRETVLAMGGLDGHMKGLSETTAAYQLTIGDLSERTAFVQEQLDILGRAGIKPTADAAKAMVPEFERLRKISNLAPKEFNAAIESITEDEGTLHQLRAANTEAERLAIVKGIAGRIAENRAMGMTTKQAIEATKALNKLTSAGPLDRFKQAAKLRAMGGAMGVAGGAEASQILMKGARATEDERRQLQDYLSQLSGAQSAAATGTIGGEIFATSLADKLGLQELLGASSPFNVRGADALKVNEDAAKALNEINPKVAEGVDWVQRIFAFLDKNPLLQMGMGAIGALVGFFTGGAFGALLGSVLRGGIPGVGGLKGAAGKLGGAARMAGGAAAVAGAGYAGWEAGNWLNENTPIQEWLASGIDKMTGLDKNLMNTPAPAGRPAATTAPSKAAEKVVAAEEKKVDTITEQLNTMKEDSLTLKKMLTVLEESNELSKELIAAVTLSEEDKKKATDMGDRLSMIREGSKRYKNAFS